MKYRIKINQEQVKYFLYFALGLLILLEVMFYRTGFLKILLIALKLSLLVHLPGYLIALRLFKEDLDTPGLLFLGLAFGLILSAFWYYLPSVLGVNINHITYVTPVFLLVVGLMLNLGKKEKEPVLELEEKNEEEVVEAAK